MRVRRDLDAAHHARSDRDGAAADRLRHDRHRVLQTRQPPVENGRGVVEKGRVVRSEQGEVALNADGEHARDVLLVVAALLQLHLRVVLHGGAAQKRLRPSMIKPELVDAFCRLRCHGSE